MPCIHIAMSIIIFKLDNLDEVNVIGALKPQANHSCLVPIKRHLKLGLVSQSIDALRVWQAHHVCVVRKLGALT